MEITSRSFSIRSLRLPLQKRLFQKIYLRQASKPSRSPSSNHAQPTQEFVESVIKQCATEANQTTKGVRPIRRAVTAELPLPRN